MNRNSDDGDWCGGRCGIEEDGLIKNETCWCQICVYFFVAIKEEATVKVEVEEGS